MKKVLKLTLEFRPFQVMMTGEKTIEFREPRGWIKARLFTKGGELRHYDEVLFINGYGANRPSIRLEYPNKVHVHQGSDLVQEYSNGLKVIVKEGTFCIHLGKVLEIGNWEE